MEPDQLSSIFLSLLLVTTLVANGVVGIFAATSQRHWLIRAVIALGVLLPLLVARALEPFVVLLLQTSTIVVSVGFWRTASRIRVEYRSNADLLLSVKKVSRVSMANILAIVALVAILFAIATNLPTLNTKAWQSMILIGCCMGWCATFPLALDKYLKWRVQVPLAIAFGLLSGIPLAWLDWLVPSLVGWAGWPPESIAMGFMGIADEGRPILAWFAISASVCLLTRIWVLLLGVPSRRSIKRRPVTRFVAATVVAAIPLYGLWVLLRPPFYTDDQGTATSDLERIEVLARSVATSKFAAIEIDWEQCSRAQLQAAFVDMKDDLESLRLLLQTNDRLSIDFESPDLPMQRSMNFRSVARAFAATGRLAIMNNDVGQAFSCYMDAVRFGFVARRGGLLIDGYVGMACSSDGSYRLYNSRDQFRPAQCRDAVQEILALADQAEGCDAFMLRDRSWAQQASGWHGRVQQWLGDVSGDSLLFSESDHRNRFLQEQALMRLLAVELALSAYQSENKRWPAALLDLVPKYLSLDPVDPFDPGGGTLRYQRKDDGYLLYSVGQDQVDEGGMVSVEDEFLFQNTWTSGDLRLDAYFVDEQDQEVGDTAKGA